MSCPIGISSCDMSSEEACYVCCISKLKEIKNIVESYKNLSRSSISTVTSSKATPYSEGLEFRGIVGEGDMFVDSHGVSWVYTGKDFCRL